MRKKVLIITIILFITVIFTACSKGTEGDSAPQSGAAEDSGEERIVLTLGTVTSSAALRKQVDAYNQQNSEYMIEIKEYGSENVLGSDGINTIQMEILSGKGPDLIDFGNLYTQGAVSKGITEDLSLYMEADEEFYEEDYFTNILDAYRVDGKRYVVSPWFTVRTVAGRREDIGDMTGWNMQELMDRYQSLHKSILMPGDSRAEVFGFLGMGSMGNFVDWEQGTCSFEGEAFWDLIAFCDLFPEYRVYEENYSALEKFRSGEAFVYPASISDVCDAAKIRLIFGDVPINYIGYPMDGKSGNIIVPGRIVLGINKNSSYKEVAWEFIKSFLLETYQSGIENGIPVLRSEVEQRLAKAKQIEYEQDENGNQVPIVKAESLWEGDDPIEIVCITEQDAEDFMKIITGAKAAYGVDYALNDIVWEEINLYFNEGRDLDSVLDTLQSRASVFMSENYQ